MPTPAFNLMLHQFTEKYLLRRSYDGFGRITNKIDAAGQVVLGYSYDANNRLTNRWTPANGGVNTRFVYDPVGNLTAIHYPQSSILYVYDPLNRVQEMHDAVGITKFAFTKTSQLASEDGPWSNDVLTNVYAHQLRASATLDTWTTSYGYDAVRRLHGLTNNAGSFAYSFQGASSLRSAVSLPNGSSIQNSFDGKAQLTETKLVNSSATVLNAHTYGYNALGQRTEAWIGGAISASPILKWDYAYDPIGQLKLALPYDAGSNLLSELRVGYGYDAAGNLRFRTNDTTTRAFTSDKLNQLTNLALIGTVSVSGITTTNATNVTVNGLTATLIGSNYSAIVPVGNGTNTVTAVGYEQYGRQATSVVSVATALQYDANGNMVFDGRRGFTYDDENQLIGITQSNEWRTEFVYDGLGRRRIRKEFVWTGSGWSQTNETRYVFDGLLAIQERDGNNAVKVTYTRGLDLSGGMQAAGGIGGLLARSDASGAAFYHGDAVGNVTALIDASQNSVAGYSYDPYGNVLSAVGSLAGVNEMQFSSMPKHAASGLSLYTFRAYSSHLQRFTQTDPIGITGGLNLHGFVGNGPVNRIDPHGLWFRETFHDIGTIVGDFLFSTPGGGGDPDSYASQRTALLGPTENFLPSMFADVFATAGDVATDYVVDSLGGYGLGALCRSARHPLSKLGSHLWDWPGAAKTEAAGFKVGQVLPDGRIAGNGPGAALRNGPDFSFRTGTPHEVYRRLETYHGIDPALASERLHAIKAGNGFGAADNVVLDLTGNVYNPGTGEWIGSLTQGGKKFR